MKTALITGITGQDGSYLAEHLLAKGYSVHGIVRRASMFNRSRIDHLRNDPGIESSRLTLHYADLNDATTLRRLIHRTQPAEVYHLAGQSHVGLSFEIPESTCHEIANCTLGLLEICRDLPYPVRFYHASSAEIFGCSADHEVPQGETTPFRPSSPYGCAKAFATNLCRVYRESYGLFACSGIAYNHESPRRGESFVTRKITSSAARVSAGLQHELTLGNLDASRDWGYAPEYVVAMWSMLQEEVPSDYVIATGRSTTVREFVQAAFSTVDITIAWEGQGLAEVGRDGVTGRIILGVDPNFYRPAEPGKLVGDPSHAAKCLGWKAETSAQQLAILMTREDRRKLGAS